MSDLKDKLIKFTLDEDNDQIRSLVGEFKEIAQDLSGEIYGEKSLLYLRMYLREIKELEKLRGRNPVFDRMTRLTYLSLREAYCISLYRVKLNFLCRSNPSDQMELTQVLKEVNKLAEEARPNLGKHQKRLVRKLKNRAKYRIKKRFSSVYSSMVRGLKNL